MKKLVYLKIIVGASVVFGLLKVTHSAEMSLDKKLVEKNKALSQNIDYIAKSIDVYLTGHEVTKKPNKSAIIFSNPVNWSEGGEFTYAPRLKAILRLPNLEKKLQLKFTSYDEDREDRGINKNRLKVRERDDDYGASIGFFHELGNIKTTFRPRFAVGETSHLLAFESDAEKKDFLLNLRLELFGRSDDGTGEFFAVNVSYELNDKTVLSFINEEQYTDGDNTFSTNHGPKLSYAYTDRMSQGYALIFESNSQPVFHLDQYVLSSTFSHQLYRKVLHYSITPYLAFPKAQGFEANPGLNVNVEFIF